jgi:hypothetical protein
MAAYDQFLQYLAQSLAGTNNQPPMSPAYGQRLGGRPISADDAARAMALQSARSAPGVDYAGGGGGVTANDINGQLGPVVGDQAYRQASAARWQNYQRAQANANPPPIPPSPTPASAPAQAPNYAQAGGSFQMMPGGQVQLSEQARANSQSTRHQVDPYMNRYDPTYNPDDPNSVIPAGDFKGMTNGNRDKLLAMMHSRTAFSGFTQNANPF